MDGEDDLRDFVTSKVAISTKKQNERIGKRFIAYLRNKGIDDELQEIDPYRMNNIIGGYIKTATRDDGTEYEPESLTTMHRALARFMEEQKYPYNIVTSEEFNLSRLVLHAKKKELKQKGKGNKPNKSEPLSEQEEEKLWTTNTLGYDFPGQLLGTVWFNNTKYLGFRGNDESRQLRWGDIMVKTDSQHGQFLEWNERTTKTRQGKGTHHRPFLPKIFQNKENPGRCPVMIDQKYASRRPVEMLAPEAPFYLAINHTRNMDSYVWFKRSPLGVNMLKCMMQGICKSAGISGHKTNHSVRRTMINRLLDHGVSAHATAQLAGHKNVAAVAAYAMPNLNQQHGMASVLMGESAERCVPSICPSRPIPPRPLPAPASSRQLAISASTVSHESMSLAVPAPTVATVNEQQQTMYGMFAGASISGGHFSFNVQM